MSIRISDYTEKITTKVINGTKLIEVSISDPWANSYSNTMNRFYYRYERRLYFIYIVPISNSILACDNL
jgi:hypothetical protein